MSGEPATHRELLLDCALALSDTSAVAERLDVVVRAATRLDTAWAAAIHLLDDEGVTLAPAAASPGSAADLPALQATGSDADDPATAAVRDRLETTSDGNGSRALPAGAPAAAVHLPLIIRHPSESPDVEGVLSFASRVTPSDDDLAALRALAALAAVAAHQARLEAALAERSDWFDRLAHTDPLTGLANRRTLDRVLELELARAARQDSDLCVAIFSVDGHDRIAEQHGASAADDTLRRVATSLAEAVRLVDTVARYGRAEFVVVAPGSTGLAMATRAADVIGRVEPVEGGAPIGVSVGVASFPDHGTTAEALLDAAERALGQARTRGGAIVAAG